MSIATDSNAEQVYPPLREVRDTLRVKWYRCPVDHKRLRELSARSDYQGWKQAGGHSLLYLLLAAFSVLLWNIQLWLAFWPSLWCLGFVATFFKGTAAHELGHGTVFKTRYLNRLFLHGVCLISWWDPYDYAASHTYHHRYTTHRAADRENILPLKPSFHPLLLLQLFTLNLVSKPARNFSKGGFLWTVYLTAATAFAMPSRRTDIPSQEWLNTLHEDQPGSFRKSVNWSRVLIVFHLSVLVIAIASGWWVLPFVVTLPAYIANIGSYILGTTQHCGLKENDTDFRKNTRSIKLPSFLAFLYWHMNWHTEHHMYAGVPCYNLKALARELEADMPEPRTLLAAWKEMRNTWHKQKSDPGYAFDTPLPASVLACDTHANENLAESIGDLAPQDSALR